jgi:hypothetical protein
MQKSTPSLTWRNMFSSTSVGLAIKKQTSSLWDKIIEQFAFVLTKSFSLCCELKKWSLS